MTEKTYREALTDALFLEMRRDENVFVMGEDVVGGTGSPHAEPGFVGGVFGVTGGLHEEFGLDRCIDMPISEAGIAGTAAGAALAGKRPVAEIMFCDFMGLCLDQLMNQAAKFRYMFGGKATCPMVLRTTYGAGMNAASQHSQSLHPLVTAIPGLKVAMPSTPADAKGLLSTAIRDDDPCYIFRT
jgi:Pyruvate/2-oxoglutarate dehydrogenase complex, dehydrogenase (E1) component, eukaryotic type, beta subunit